MKQMVQIRGDNNFARKLRVIFYFFCQSNIIASREFSIVDYVKY
jgi:hypothetical protein